IGPPMLFHGFAHGTEMPVGATLAACLAGFSIATFALTLLGSGLGAQMMKVDRRMSRTLGGLISATGVLLAAV
ncbi:MAG: HupE/UreJ family protein, partial [Flavobacteriaceae bacterium]|nr:HupE/UreJ family protein [Flavobacteriaceae bacterium]